MLWVNEVMPMTLNKECNSRDSRGISAAFIPLPYNQLLNEISHRGFYVRKRSSSPRV